MKSTTDLGVAISHLLQGYTIIPTGSVYVLEPPQKYESGDILIALDEQYGKEFFGS